MLTRLINFLILMTALYTTTVFAVTCQNVGTPLENTICNNDDLRWLDSTIMAVVLAKNDSPQLLKQYHDWQKSFEKCTSEKCIENAYYEGISMLSDVTPDFEWEGRWWNMSVPNAGGSTLQFSRSGEWSVTTDIHVWAGLNNDEYTAEARKVYGMLLVEWIAATSDCKVLLIPQRSGMLQVYGNADWGCKLSMLGGGFIDGKYQRADSDPRSKSTLLSLGIMPDKEMDTRFRELVGEDYQAFVNTANTYIYLDDLDNVAASVVSMWIRGAANSQSAIIMYTKSDIWAARVEKSQNGKPQVRYYSTKGSDQHTMPRTLVNWKLRFLDK